MTRRTKGDARVGKCALNTATRVSAFALIALSSGTASAADAASSTGGLSEVLVTARYREENLQQTPIAITALTGAALEAASLTNVTDLAATVPNLFIHPGDAAEGPTPTVSMRGVTAGDYNFTYEPAVGVYIDDVYHNTLFGSAVELVDIDRVEVLRGPQGTLFGNASIGGAIRIFSKTPQGDGTGYADVTVGSRNRVDVKAGFDVAIVPDTLFARVTGVAKRQDGYVDILDFTCEMNALGTPALAGTFPTSDRSAHQRDCKVGSNGGTQFAGARAMLRYIATSDIEFNLSASYYKADDESPPEVLIEAHPSTTDNFASAYNDMIFATYGVRYDNRFLPPPGRPYSNYSSYTSPFRGHTYPNKNLQHSGDLSGAMDWDVAENTHLKVILARSEYGGSYTHQATQDPFGISMAYGTFDVEQTSAEARFTGSLLNDKLEWAAGVFGLWATEHLGGDIDYVTLSWEVDDTVKARNKSGFVHAVFHLTDRLSITGGGRFTAVHKSYDFQHPGLLVVPTPSIAKEHHPDWLANVSYQVTEDAMVYAQASTGFRPGGIFARPVTIYQLLPFEGEELTAYEVGAKTQWFGNRLRVNAAAFYSDYNKHLTTRGEYQCLGEAPPPTPKESPTLCPPGGFVTWGVSITTPANIKGLELEVTVEPVDALLFNLSGGYHRYQSGVHTPGAPGYVFPGNIGQPQYNATGSIQYTFEAPGGSVTPRLDWFYQSHQTNGPRASSAPPDPLYVLPSLSTFNARITYEFTDSNWSMSLSCTNLTDKYYYHDLFSGSGLALSGNVAAPREWAFTVRRNF